MDGGTDFTITRLVLETLEPLPEDRKCFRMINGVLVERTVKDVIPALKTNSEGLKKVLDDLLKQYKTKQEEMDKWKVRHMASRGGWATRRHANAPFLYRKRTTFRLCSNSNGRMTISNTYPPTASP